jgi:hypothetical protein
VLLHRLAGRAPGDLLERATGIGASYDLGTIEGLVGGDSTSCSQRQAFGPVADEGAKISGTFYN